MGETDFLVVNLSQLPLPLPSEHTNEEQTVNRNKNQPQIHSKPETYFSFAEKMAATNIIKVSLFCLVLLVNHSIAFGQLAKSKLSRSAALAVNDELYKSQEQQMDTRMGALEGKALQWHLKKYNLRMDNVIGDKIVGGVDAEEGEAPFQAQLFRKTWKSSLFICGGSLISPTTILSAGHCVTKSA